MVWLVAEIEDAAMWCAENPQLRHTVEFADAAATAECVIVGTDIKTAFGSMCRSSAIGEV